MKILVDGDACPRAIKEILFRAADRVKIDTILVANHSMQIPPSRFIKLVIVPSGFDVADDEIIKRLCEGDLVVTADIPLANEVIDNKGLALNPRGELYHADTIKARLTMRDFMDTLRSSGIQTGGQPPIAQSEKQAFANHLDQLIGRHRRDPC